MDLAALWPKYIDVARGGIIMCVVGYLINPWRFVNAPGTFITVLNSFGMFVAPLAGVNAVDFWLVRKRNWRIPDLYIGDSRSIYWFTAGWNWRAMATWCLTIWPSFPGFISGTSGAKVAIGWTRTFQVSWIVGFMGGGLVYYVICLVFPPLGRPYETILLDVNEAVVEGYDPAGEKTEMSSASAEAVDIEIGKH
jgi:NCS1 family nucleobase:cation symporter-1